jgi:hypothetical protein
MREARARWTAIWTGKPAQLRLECWDRHASIKGVRQAFPSVQWMLAAVLVADAAVLGTIAVVSRAGADEASRAPGPASGSGSATGSGSAGKDTLTAAPPLDPAWAMCFHDRQDVSRVALTYLDGGIDARVTEQEMLRWFGKLSYDSIDVWQLEHKDGTRRISFELDWTHWPSPPSWDEVTRGWKGDDLCSALRFDLLKRGVGRPRPAAVRASPDPMVRSRHDFEFFDERREDRYADRDLVGTLADVVAQDQLPELLRWVEVRGAGTDKSGNAGKGP